MIPKLSSNGAAYPSVIVTLFAVLRKPHGIAFRNPHIVTITNCKLHPKLHADLLPLSSWEMECR